MVEFMASGTVSPCLARFIHAAPKDDSMDDWATQLADNPNKDENLARITVRLMFVHILRWLSESGESEEREPLSLLRWPNSGPARAGGSFRRRWNSGTPTAYPMPSFQFSIIPFPLHSPPDPFSCALELTTLLATG